MKTHTLRIGAITAEISLENGRLHAVALPREVPDDLDTPMLAQLMAELAQFEINFADAPPFIGKVWQRMMQIPAGSALTYSELADAVGHPLAVRAVGQACATNRRLLVVPCHRVVAAEGLGGFGPGLAWKRKLLELEAA